MRQVETYFKMNRRVISIDKLLEQFPDHSAEQIRNSIYGLRRLDVRIHIVKSNTKWKYNPAQPVRRKGHGHAFTLLVLDEVAGTLICLDRDGNIWRAKEGI